jgi:hypothetical protein
MVLLPCGGGPWNPKRYIACCYWIIIIIITIITTTTTIIIIILYLFLDAFQCCEKKTSSCLSLLPRETTRILLDRFSWNFILRALLRSVEKIQIWLKSEKIKCTLHKDLRVFMTNLGTKVIMVACYQGYRCYQCSYGSHGYSGILVALATLKIRLTRFPY